MTESKTRRYSVGGVTYATPEVGMTLVTRSGDYGVVLEVVPQECKDGREIFRCRIAKSDRHESRWTTTGMLRREGMHFSAL